MKLPIPFLLYTTSLGLCGFAGWEVYQLLPLQKTENRQAATKQGMKQATDHLSIGARSGPTEVDWAYTPANRSWWLSFDEANFIGKLPPPPPPPPDEVKGPQVEPEKPVVPLESIIELVSLVYDSKDDGRGELSHVIVRYKPEANVQPPEWYLREAASSTASGAAGGGPGDRTPPPRRPGGNQDFQGRNNRGQRPTTPTSAAPTAMPASPNNGGDVLQKVWVQGGDDVRRDPHLWPPYENIRLVRVGPTAYSAFFVREQKPPTGEGGDDKQEELFKTTAEIDQAMLRELARINGESTPVASGGGANPASSATENIWENTPETTWKGNRCNISQDDEAMFGKDDSIYEKAYVDTWVSKSSGRRGLQFKSVEPELARKFGIAPGEVLLSVNNRAVQSKADAIQFGKQEYNKGVRTFVTVWLSNGQEVERIYQAPPGKN